MKNPLLLFKNQTFVSGIFFLAVIIVLSMNTLNFRKEYQDLREKRQSHPFIFLGWKFSGLQDILAEAQFVSYYTDKDLDDIFNATQFAQAQHTMAPIILDSNNLENEYIILDCSSLKKAGEYIAKEQLIPLRQNQFGIILAKRPQRQ